MLAERSTGCRAINRHVAQAMMRINEETCYKSLPTSSRLQFKYRSAKLKSYSDDVILSFLSFWVVWKKAFKCGFSLFNERRTRQNIDKLLVIDFRGSSRCRRPSSRSSTRRRRRSLASPARSTSWGEWYRLMASTVMFEYCDKDTVVIVIYVTLRQFIYIVAISVFRR